MSRCVEKSFAPLLAVWSYQGVSPRAPPRGYGMGRAGFLLREGGNSVGANRMPLPRNRKIGTACAVTRQSGRGHWATAVGRWHTA